MTPVIIKQWHGRELEPRRAIELQKKLAGSVIARGSPGDVALIAAADISVNRETRLATAAVVLCEYPSLDIVETVYARSPLSFPYVPGLLSFREMLVILEACEKLSRQPGLFLVDGQGLAHPRRLGLACHLGLFLDIPTVRCAKSRLIGTHAELGEAAGSQAQLIDVDEIIGVVLRTKTSIRPVYVSVGHRIGLEEAVGWILACCRGYRLPEPLRQAHLAAGRYARTTPRW